MALLPNQDVVAAIEAGITQVTRRVEFYESDGVTPFYPNGSTEDIFRLNGGNVSVDSARDERRQMDVTFDNKDNKLRPDPNGGMWYDKIIRPYRGVRYASRNYKPKILIIESQSQSTAVALRGIFFNLGFDRVDVNLNATNLSHLSGYAIIVSDSGSGVTTKAALLNLAYSSGFDIMTKGLGNGIGELPFVTAEAVFTNTAPLTITPRTIDTPLSGGWTAEATGSVTGMASVTLRATAVGVATSLNDSMTHFTAIVEETTNARWFDYRPLTFGTQGKALLAKALYWLWGYTPYKEWETPLGEFLIDTMSTSNFPAILSASTRDQTKRCLKSKIEKNENFVSGTKIQDMITALAANSGIKKISLGLSGTEVIKDTIVGTRGDERWKLMSDASRSLGRNLFFDVDGYLTTSPFADPTLGSPIISFKTGAQGNLAGYQRSLSDARIYNHIIVTGEPTDASGVSSLGYFGEAKNESKQSPTSIERLGDISYFYNSSFFRSDAQCLAYAKLLLAQTAFEQYEMNYSSIVYPWMDAGVVIDFQDPDALDIDPTRFLGDTFTIPLGLGAMSGTGKRVLYIESEDEVAGGA